MKDKIEQAIDQVINEENPLAGLQKETSTTRVSSNNAKVLVAHKGKPESLTFSFSRGDWYNVKATWADGYTHNFRGFSWGYAGEGPHGLLEFILSLGIYYTIEQIAAWPRDERSWVYAV